MSIVQLATVHIEKLDMRACRGYRRPEVIVFVLDCVEFLHKNSHNDDGIDTAHWHTFSLELMLRTDSSGKSCVSIEPHWVRGMVRTQMEMTAGMITNQGRGWRGTIDINGDVGAWKSELYCPQVTS